MTRRLCVYRSSLGEPVRRPLRRCAGCACPLRVRGSVPIRAAMDDAAPRRAWIAAPVSSPSGGAPTVAVSALDAPGVSAASSAVCAGTRRSVCVFWRLLAAHAPRGTSGRPNASCSPCGSRGRGDRTGQERSPCAVRAPPARTRAGRPRTRRNPQVRAFAGGDFWGAPACLRGARASGAHAGGTPAHPAQPSGARFCMGRFLGSPGVPARCACGRDARAPGATLRCARPCRGRLVGKPRHAISRFRHQDAPHPSSHFVGAEGRRMRGKRAQECRKPLIDIPPPACYHCDIRKRFYTSRR